MPFITIDQLREVRTPRLTATKRSGKYLIADNLNEIRSLFASIMHRHFLLVGCRSGGVKQSRGYECDDRSSGGRWALSVNSASSGKNRSGRSLASISTVDISEIGCPPNAVTRRSWNSECILWLAEVREL